MLSLSDAFTGSLVLWTTSTDLCADSADILYPAWWRCERQATHVLSDFDDPTMASHTSKAPNVSKSDHLGM